MTNEESTFVPVHTQSPPVCTMQSGTFAGVEPTSQQQLASSLGVTDYPYKLVLLVHLRYIRKDPFTQHR